MTAELRKALTQGTRGTLGDALRVPGLGGVQRLLLQRRDREQRQRRNTQRDQFLGLLEQQIDRQPLDARHRRHALTAVLAVEHEHRQDQIVDGQRVLAHQATREIVATIATQASGRKKSIGRNEAHNGLLARRAGANVTYIGRRHDRTVTTGDATANPTLWPARDACASALSAHLGERRALEGTAVPARHPTPRQGLPPCSAGFSIAFTPAPAPGRRTTPGVSP